MWSNMVPILCVIMLLLFSCSPALFNFEVKNSYTREYFTGRDIGGHTIGICPFLTRQGAVMRDMRASREIVKLIAKERPDVAVVPSDQVEQMLCEKLDSVALHRFYQLLYQGDVTALQVLDTVWNALTVDYLMVIRMRNGMNIRTFNRVARKRLALEAELWDRTAMEAVWRVSVNGFCGRAGISDRRFIDEAIKKIYAELPATLPSYDTKTW